MDIVDAKTRSKMMSGIKAKNTSPEIYIRKYLHSLGFRFRLHANNLPGKPDVLMPKHRLAIFIHGCFWHGHKCRYFKLPKTRTEFWLDKISKNQQRDILQLENLKKQGWRVLVIWECAVRYMKKNEHYPLMNMLKEWISVGGEYLELDESLAESFRAAE